MKFVIDTNVLFSALLRDSITRKIILSDVFDLYVPEYLYDEIARHDDLILEKSKLSTTEYMALLLLFQKHTKIVKHEVYQRTMPLAEQTMKEIDVTDSPFLALALAIGSPIWTNDGHFKRQNLVDVYTTNELLELLQLESSS
jgi:predicted nucleic acid-binding protein